MQIKHSNFYDKACVLIYLSKSEAADNQIQELIKKYKETCQEVAVFIGGSKSAETVLGNMILDRGSGGC